MKRSRNSASTPAAPRAWPGGPDDDDDMPLLPTEENLDDYEQGGGRLSPHQHHAAELAAMSVSPSSADLLYGGGGENNNMIPMTTIPSGEQDLEEEQAASAAGAAIVRNIASFLTLSDAASLASGAFLGSASSPYFLHYHHHSRHNHLSQHHSGGVATPSSSRVVDGAGATTTDMTRTDSWAVGIDLDNHHYLEGSSSRSCGRWSALGGIETPLTPPHMEISPGATPTIVDGDKVLVVDGEHHIYQEYDSDDDERMQEILRVRTRRWAQERLSMAIFSHPGSIRSFCLDAYAAAQQIREKQEQEQLEYLQATAASAAEFAGHPDEEDGLVDPETLVYPNKSSDAQQQQQQQQQQGSTGGQLVPHHHHRRRRGRKRKEPPALQRLLHSWIDLLIFDNIPLSVLLDLLHSTGDLTLDTSWASLELTHRSVDALISALAQAVQAVWDTTTHIIFDHHPGKWLEIIKRSNAVEVTSGALKSGFQSVAHSVGTSSNLAMIQRWSAANLSTSHRGAGGSRGESGLMNNLRGAVSSSNMTQQLVNQQRLLDRLSSINDASRVLAYQEVRDDTGGLTQKELSRARRMMHYSVSLRPFVVTVALKPGNDEQDELGNELADMRSVAAISPTASLDSQGNEEDDGEDSLFMCTPQSFPPTPRERQMVMISKSRKSNDTVFKTRDKLRLYNAVKSEDERTRQMAKALEDTESLATFDDSPNHENDIELSCGNNIATKIGSTMYYSNTRSKVPLWRNSYVYFEITVLPHVGSNPPIAIPTLSIGLSSEEMPPNTLVGAMQGSVGLCTTGQILLAGQWCSPVRRGQATSAAATAADLNSNAAYRYSDGSTVGCLVRLDDDTAFETWDGTMITSGVTFSVNGQVVPQFAPTPTPLTNNGNSSTVDDSRSTSSSSSSSTTSSSSAEDDSGVSAAAATVNLIVSAAEDVYPTVTLQSAATGVLCRFSAEDVLASSREMIGAPPDCDIYAVDGSVLPL